jgi:hypothetical protein
LTAEPAACVELVDVRRDDLGRQTGKPAAPSVTISSVNYPPAAVEQASAPAAGDVLVTF